MNRWWMAIEHSWLHNLPDNLSQVAPLVTSQKHLSQICDAQQATSRTIHPGSWGARHLGNRTWHRKTHYLQRSYRLKVAASSCDQVRPTVHQMIFQNFLKAQSLPMSFVWLTMFIDFFLTSPIKQCSKPGTSSLFFEGCPWSHEVEKVLLQW